MCRLRCKKSGHLTEWLLPRRLPRHGHPGPAYDEIVDLTYLMGYIPAMIVIRQTETYTAWFDGLRDVRAKARIVTRIRRLSLGNPGDTKSVGNGISEMRIDTEGHCRRQGVGAEHLNAREEA